MRARRVLLLAGLAAIVAAIFAAASLARPMPPGANYAWAQPGCAVETTCCSQPSFEVGTVVAANPAAASDYAWAQPGTSPVTTAFAQPPGT